MKMPVIKRPNYTINPNNNAILRKLFYGCYNTSVYFSSRIKGSFVTSREPVFEISLWIDTFKITPSSSAMIFMSVKVSNIR